MSVRAKILAGNWKMNQTPTEAVQYFEALQKAAPPSIDGTHRVLFPVAYCLNSQIQMAALKAGAFLGAQNVHWEDKGAFTGELSGTVLKSIGINWVLIAHSERRQFFGETDASAAKRLKKALEIGMNIIFCVGETLAEREANQTEAVLKKQVDAFTAVFREMKGSYKGICSIAYEPVWAIGTGKTATPAQAQEAHKFIRSITESSLPILYGGSVTPETAPELMALPDVDGVLVGGASLKPDQFAKIIAARGSK